MRFAKRFYQERQNKFETVYEKGGGRRLAEGQPTNKKRLKFLRREEACRRQAYKPKETPEETREFLRREEACGSQAYKPKEISKLDQN